MKKSWAKQTNKTHGHTHGGRMDRKRFSGYPHSCLRVGSRNGLADHWSWDSWWRDHALDDIGMHPGTGGVVLRTGIWESVFVLIPARGRRC